MPLQEKRRAVLLNVAGSIFLTGNWFSFIYVMNHVSIKATSLAYMVCPILTTLLAFFLLHEKLSKLQWLAVLLSISGCLLLSYADITDMLFSMVIGFSYSTWQLMIANGRFGLNLQYLPTANRRVVIEGQHKTS